MVVPISSASRAALATAILATAVELVELGVALSPRYRVAPSWMQPATVERVVFITPGSPRARVTEERQASAAPLPATPVPARSVAAGAFVVPRDSVRVGAPLPSNTAPAAPPASGNPSRARGTGDASIAGPVFAPRGFSASTPLSRRVIDSILDSLNARMPALLWARVPTQAERDAAFRESALAMRLTGRTLLVPADPHLAPPFTVSLPFSRRKHREAARVRTDSILAENMARLTRLRERARRDSLRRDSLQRADSIHRADSLAPTGSRRLPDARTPA